MQKSLLFTTLLLVSSSLAGCRKSEAAPSTSNAAGPPSAALAASSAAAPSGPTPSCSLITKGEVEAIMHEPFEEPSESSMAGLCSYTQKGGHITFISVRLYPHETRAEFDAQTQSAASVLSAVGVRDAKREPIAGFGEEAFLIGKSEIAVYAHGKAFGIGYSLRPIEPSQRDALAKAALARL
jgi:hypothetical protein